MIGWEYYVIHTPIQPNNFLILHKKMVKRFLKGFLWPEEVVLSYQVYKKDVGYKTRVEVWYSVRNA